MELSQTFVSNIHAIYGEAGQIWLKQLPAHLADLSQLWNFRFIQPVSNLTYSFVGLVELNDNRETAIIKTAPNGYRLIPEVHWLQCIKNGVPKVYAADEQKNAFLMEYLTPGNSLKSIVQAGHDEKATRIICQTILELQSQQLKKFSFKHLSELAKDLSQLKDHIDKHTLSKAESLFRDLTADRSHDVLLHGDLHHDNIISHSASWKVIDPHGFIGDPTAEVGAMIRNPNDCFPQNRPLAVIIETRLKVLTEELLFDPQRIKAWAFCMTILSAAWNIQDFGTTTNFEIAIANAIDRTKI
jgi:streptomycin 6-kinase